MSTSLVLLGTGLLVGAVGAGIRYGGYVELIAGYDPERVTDEAGLAAFVGGYTLAIAAFILGFGLLELAGQLPDSEWPWFVFTAVILVVTARVVLGARQFESPQN
jgi:hypothetical protein